MSASEVRDIQQAAPDEGGIGQDLPQPDAHAASDVKGKGKGKAAEVVEEEEDDDDDEENESDEEDEDDEDGDETNPLEGLDQSAIMWTGARGTRRAAQKEIDYSSEEAQRKAGLAGGSAEEQEEDDGEFKGEEMEE